MSPVTPDLAGFADAQDRLRQGLGQDVTFLVPQAKTWPAGTAIDPESGEPYDPTVVPTSGAADTQVIKHCNVIFRPLIAGRKDEAIIEPSGVMENKVIALILAVADYPDVQNANKVVVNNRAYAISDIVPDGLGALHRYIVFGNPT